MLVIEFRLIAGAEETPWLCIGGMLDQECTVEMEEWLRGRNTELAAAQSHFTPVLLPAPSAYVNNNNNKVAPVAFTLNPATSCMQNEHSINEEA